MNHQIKIQYIQVLRSLSILLVVFFHVYGYMYATVHFPGCREKYHEMYFWANQCVFINIAMPMFTFISGFLFDYLYDKGKYHEFLPFIKKKILRLWLPFMVFGMLMMLTVGVEFEPWKLLSGNFSHLWYLPTLSWLFVVGWLVKTYVHNSLAHVSILIVFLFLPLFGRILPHWMGLHNITVWSGWFLLGGMVSLYKNKLTQYIRKYYLAIPLIVLFFVQEYLYPVEYDEWTWYSIIAIMLILVALWYVFSKMDNTALRLCQPLIWLSQYSFGIFIFHNWIGPYLISSTVKRVIPLEQWADAHLIIFPFALALVTLGISWFISWILMQTKVGRFLIG